MIDSAVAAGKAKGGDLDAQVEASMDRLVSLLSFRKIEQIVDGAWIAR